MRAVRLRAVSRKEFLHIWRDPRSLGLALALPALMLLLFGYALTLDVDRVPTLVLDLDASPGSRSLTARFAGSRFFDVSAAADYGEIERAIDRGECLLGVVIPEDFSRRRASRVQLLLDGSDSNTASIALGYAEAVVTAFSRETPVAVPELRVLYNPELESRNYIVPGLLAVVLMIIAALLSSLTIAREWESGTMEQLLSTPLRPAELVLGKMSAYFVLGAADALIAVVVGVLVFQVPLRGSLLLLAGSCSLFLFGALCWGILLSSLATSQLQAYQMGIITSFLPAFLLSGFIYAIENMPVPIQVITHLIPARYFISVLQGVFLKGTGIGVLAGELFFLILFAAAVFVVSTRRLAQKQKLA